MRRRGNRRGNATIEFTLVGIPLVFILISTIEMARGMWIYHTLAYSVKEGTRYAIGRGQNSPTRTTYQGLCNTVVQAGTGLLREELTLRFHSAKTDMICTCAASPDVTFPVCQADQWPPGDSASAIDNQPGQIISITGYYPFVSAISMLWPGAGSGMTFQSLTCNGPGALCLPASSQDVMQF